MGAVTATRLRRTQTKFGGPSEQQIHKAVVEHLRLRGTAGLVFIHVPNGGYRRPTEAAIFQSLGVRRGACDLLLWHQGKSFALEIKAAPGRVSEHQRQFIADMERAGAHCCIAVGVDAAVEALERWGLLRGRLS